MNGHEPFLFLLLIVTEQKRGFWLPATIKSKLLRQVLVKKEGGFILVLCVLGEWRELRLKVRLLSKTKTKASAQSSCSNLKCSLWELTGGC